MPLKIKNFVPRRQPGMAELIPDIKTDNPIDPTYPTRAFISQETPLLWPAPGEFKNLPKDQQDFLNNRYRYSGIRLRSDIKGRTIPLSKRTLDIP
jgi:hypothetical protein